jgi:hypothetical protein
MFSICIFSIENALEGKIWLNLYGLATTLGKDDAKLAPSQSLQAST